MAIFDLFSKRQKRKNGDVPEIYTFNEIPKNLRIQINHIWDDAIGTDVYGEYIEEKTYDDIHKILCREYGVYNLISDQMYPKENVISFFLNATDINKTIDVIDLFFKYINTIIENEKWKYINKKITSEQAIHELNERFKEAGIGYAFENNEIIRVDSTFIHNEITKPTIALIWDSKFSGANDEYMKAHEHYRNGRNKECLNECLKAIESTLKTICKIKNWQYAETDTARKLIQICFTNNLVPTYTQNQFTSLKNLIESGVPTIRNKQGGHGQGQNIINVDDKLTQYALNLTGTNIIFLIKQSGI